VALHKIQIARVRNLQDVRLEGLQKVNVFYGLNGSGKTSVLESIHLLGMARSFRGASIKSLITHEETSCTVFGTASLPSSNISLPLGVERMRSGEANIKIGGKAVRTIADLAEQLPLQVISADSFGLLTGPPGARRRYLDWGVFHVEHRFFAQWQRFQRCIKQRNMVLRRGKLSEQELDAWTRDLSASGTAINEYRKAYFSALVPRFLETMKRLAPSLEGLELRFRQGWDAQHSYAEALEQSFRSDIDQGYTHTGPQRADIRVTSGGHLAADTLSRGQQKLVVCGLKLAQGQLMSVEGGRSCTYLIDDLPSELDENHSRLVCSLLASMDAQIFITCVEQEEIRSVWPRGEKLSMFHVEHGNVRVVARENTSINNSEENIQ
jgi:DNA replication and repair protein RecF